MTRTTNGSILRRDWKFALDITCILLALPIWLPLMILLMLVTRISPLAERIAENIVASLTH